MVANEVKNCYSRVTMEYKTKYKSIVFMGKIASGKGTQANAISSHFGGIIYSNGNKVRETAQLPTVFGKKIKEIYETGLLIPEWVASYWMTHAIVTQFTDERVIFEGVAKKPNEAELFHDIHEMVGRPYIVFNLEVSDEEVHERSALRARDVVDNPKAVDTRLAEYQTYTTKSIEFFRTKGTLIDIDGSLDSKIVQEKIFKYLIN